MVEYLNDDNIDDDIRLLLNIQDDIYLNLDNIPQQFHELLTVAQKWGILNGILMDKILEQADSAVLLDLVKVVDPHRPAIEDWLTLPEWNGSNITQEYLAFTNLLQGIDKAKAILRTSSD